jgi:hypothetical protein
MWQSTQKIWEHFNRLELGVHVGLLIVGDQWSYYIAVTNLNYISHQ